jgi:hypothetical protein
MEAQKGAQVMDWSNVDAVPMTAAILVLLAIVALGSLTFAFSGSIHF